MTPDSWISIAAVGVPSAIAGLIWLVRLEGRVNAAEARADAKIIAAVARLDVLEVAAKGHEETKIEVVRLQEQIKHLTDLLERYFIRAPRTRKASDA
jgi:hypothetical protein